MAAAFGDGKFVAAGFDAEATASVVYHSNDGENFSAGTISGSGVYDVAYGNNKFVAVGISGFVATSTDGNVWTTQDSKTAATLNGVAYGGGKFVAVGDGGTIVSSEDGVNWITETPKTASGNFKSVAYGQSKFVVVGPAGLMQTSVAVETPQIELTDLEVSSPGGIDYTKATKSYTVTVPNGTASVDVTPTLPAVAGASATVNSQPLVGGKAAVTLDADGSTTITVDVKATGYKDNEYTITVNEQPLVKLTGLQVTPPGGLSFLPNTKNYSVTVPNGTASVEVTPSLPAVAGASATVNSQALSGGKATVTLDADGTTVIEVDVHATGYTSNKYTITVTEDIPQIKLADLEVNSPGGLAFDPDNDSYAVTVKNGVASVDVTPTLPGVAGTTVTVNGTSTTGGAVTVALDADRTTEIVVAVTAPGHTANQYTITVTEQELIKLTGLQVTPPGGLSFNPNNTTYTVSVPYGTGSVDVTPSLPAVAGANATVNGLALAGGKASVSLDADGTTVIEVDVTAPGYTDNQYTISVTTLPLIKLTDLEVNSPGGLAFDPDDDSYAVAVKNGVASVDVTPTLPGVAGTAVTVNGTSTTGGAVTVALDADRTTEIIVAVTAPGHTSNQYTITVTEEELIKLTGLTVTPGGITFDPDTKPYSVAVPYGTTKVDVTPALPPVIGAAVTVNGQTLTDGKVTVDLDGAGTASFTVDVTAPGYTDNQYTISVTTLPLIKLTDLEVNSPGGLAFDPDDDSYAVTVKNGVASVDVTPTLPGVAGTAVTVNGTSTTGGAVTVALDADRTTEIIVAVTAPGHTANQYTITVTEEELIKLTGLTVTPGGITFDPDTKPYSVAVPYGTTKVDVTPALPPVIGAAVTVDGQTLTDGKVTVDLDGAGTASFTVDVTAPGYTDNQYTISVTTLPLIKLTDLEVNSPGGLAFDPDDDSYAVTVKNGVASVDVTPTLPGVAGTAVTVNGTSTTGGAVTVALDADRTTEIIVAVTAPGHTANQYTITVTEEELIKLTGLTVTPGGITFDPDTKPYSVAVPYGTTKVDVTPALPPVIGAAVTVNGQTLTDGKVTVDLDGAGTASFTVDVTAPGYTDNQYTISVTTLPLIKLTDLEVNSPGGLAFDPDDDSYAVTVKNGVASVDVTPTLPGVAGTAVTVNGTSTTGGAVTVALDADRTTEIIVAVTAPGHTANQYTITVTEEELIKLTGLDVTPADALTFDQDTTTYAVTAPYGTTQVDVTLTLPAVAGASATVNGTATTGEAVSITLDSDGTTEIQVNVTAPGYTENQYTITVTIGLPSTDATLSNLTVDAGTLTPDFASNVDTYTVAVPYSVSTLNVTPTFNHGGATMTVNGTLQVSGNAVPVALTVGPNTITILVTAQDGVTTQEYTIAVTRAAYVPPVEDKVKGTLQGNITKLIGNGNKLSADVYSPDGKMLLQAGVDIIGANGKFELNKIEPGSYRMVIYVLGDNGTKLAGQTAMLSVNANKEATASASVIDPFGVVTDAISKKAVDGVNVTVYWADTALNKSQGRTPGAKVELPRLSPMTNKNANGQTTGKDGQFGWLLLPEGDYYIVAEKEGYDQYDGRNAVLHVGQTAVQTNITLQPKVLEEGVIEPYITGYPDGTFKPDRGITRAELASILLRVINIKAEASVSIYSDVSASNWAAPAIAEVTKRGLMVGYPDGTFQPNQQMSRAEIAIVLGKVKQLSGTPQKSTFTDIDKHWAKNAILLAEQAGLLSGHTDGKFRPDNALTRAEAVVIFNKVLGWNDLNVDKPQRWSDVPKNYWAYKDIMRASVPHMYQKLGNGMVIWK
ncbi:cadherin-like beta sandwich domain-containing protein [Tumebacillus avium]|nr:cadherin-like beta sandwich domain-containing protein [Tumebacillus avium]